MKLNRTETLHVIAFFVERKHDVTVRSREMQTGRPKFPRK